MIINEKKVIFKLTLVGKNLVYDLIQEGIDNENFGIVDVEVKENDDRVPNGSSITFVIKDIDKNIFGTTHAKIFNIFSILISRLRKGSANCEEYSLQYWLMIAFSQYITMISNSKDEEGKIDRYNYFKNLSNEIIKNKIDKKYVYRLCEDSKEALYYLEFGFYACEIHYSAIFDINI